MAELVGNREPAICAGFKDREGRARRAVDDCPAIFSSRRIVIPVDHHIAADLAESAIISVERFRLGKEGVGTCCGAHQSGAEHDVASLARGYRFDTN